MAASLVAALGACALAAPAAFGAASAELKIGAELLDQPKGQPWAVNLNLGAQIVESTGPENLPITTRLFFQFPKATVNSDKFPVCRATDAQLTLRGASACPSNTLIGEGTANVRAISLPFDATVKIFNGPGTRNKRTIIIFGSATTVDVQVPLRATLQKVNKGNVGWEVSLPFPEIQVLQGELVSVESFNVKIGKRIRKGGKRISYIEAPTSCPSGGWPFLFRDELRGGDAPISRKVIPCTLLAVDPS
jgi:hypothetical protein